MTRLTVAAVVLIAVQGMGFPTRSVAQGEEDAIEALRQVFTDNRERLNSFTCQFQWIEGTADSIDDAWANRYAVTIAKDGLYVEHEGTLRCDLTCVNGDPTIEEIMAVRRATDPKVRFTSMGCAAEKELFRPELGMRITMLPVFKVVNLVENQGFETVNTPLALGIMGPSEKFSPVAWIEGGKAGKYLCKYRGVESFEGINVDVLECGFEPGAETQSKIIWYLDLARGGLPIRYQQFNADGSLNSELRAVAIRKLENGAYICAKSIQAIALNSGRYRVRLIVLQSIDLSPPTRESFAIDLEPGTKVINVRDMRSQVVLEGKERFYLDELPKWITRCNEKLDVRLAEQDARGARLETPTHHPTNPLWWWSAAAAATIVVVGAAILVRRRYAQG